MDLTQLEALARLELARHGLEGWTFGLARTRRRLGACKYATKRIEIAAYYALHSPEASVLDTLRHEIAHALAGPAAGHGPEWRAWAVRLGATPRSCESTGLAVVEPGDWQATCPACGRTLHLYRQPRSPSGYRCRCPARAPVTFAYVGDPARRPPERPSPGDSARWEATCDGCGTVHFRVRPPKPGLWRCGCPARQELAWRPRSRTPGGPDAGG
jgi:hypothetical protein